MMKVRFTPGDIQQAKTEAALRTARHEGKASQNKMSNNFEVVGLLGEIAFGKVFDLPVDFTARPFGDNKDFDWHGWTIDVKTRYSWNDNYGLDLLQMQRARRKCDIIVHVIVNEAMTEAVVVGWMFDECIRKTYPAQMKPKTTLNHVVPARDLSTLDSLKMIKANPASELPHRVQRAATDSNSRVAG